MWSCEEEIEAAVLTLGIAPTDFKKISVDLSLTTLNEIKSQFVTGHPRNWWWEFFRHTDTVAQNTKDQGYDWLDRIIPETSLRVWFVTEPDGNSNEFGLYDVIAKNIRPVLKECCYFEYYVISKELDWLICENHHGAFMVVGEIPARPLQKIILEYPDEWILINATRNLLA